VSFYTAVGDDSRVIIASESSRVAMREANRAQKKNPDGFVTVYIYADQLAPGARAGHKSGWCYAAADNYPGPSFKLKRQER
jgi:hypothetical protein